MTADRGGRKSEILCRGLAVVVLFGAAMLFSACEDRSTRDAIDQHADETRRSLDKVMVEAPSKHYNPLVITDKVWTGSTATRMQRGLPLPPRFENGHGITVVSSDSMNLTEIADAITSQTGIPVHISQVGPTPSARSNSLTPNPSPATASASSASTAGLPSSMSMPIAYEGSLSGLLERVAGYFGINWRFDGSTISIARFETRVFVLEVLPGTSKAESGIQQASQSGGSGGGGGASGGASAVSMQSTLNQTSKSSIDIKYWEEFGQTLTSMLAGAGSVVVSPSVGTVTVTTTPELMHTVAEYITQQNQRLSRQIAINVEVYSVELTNGIDFNIAFSTLINNLSNNFKLGLTGVSAPAAVSGFSGGGTLNLAILNPNNTSQALGSDVFTALSGIGDTTKVAKFPMITLNNIPVIRRIGEQVNYVAQTTTTVTGTSGTAATSAIPGQIQKGFTVAMTPRLLDDGRILLDYSLDIIDIVNIKQFNTQCGDTTNGTGTCTASGGTGSATGSSTLQLPDTTERAFTQQSVLKSGSTLIMGGAEQEDLTQSSQGAGSPYDYLLGGGISSRKAHTMIFFVVTPQVVDMTRSEQE